MNELWERLGRVRGSRLQVEEAGERRNGSGAITIDRPDPWTIVWEESGTWEGERGPATSYRDRLRWNWAADRGILTLQHARRGDEAPVHLGDLAAGPDGRYHSLSPHLCGADTYDAALQVEEEELVLTWRVNGPKKSYTMVRRYA